MRSNERIHKRIVLVGGGHAHVTVLRSFGMQPEPGVEITLVAKELDAPYSGMLPGFVAGHYDFDACHIDLVRLAQFAGARLVHAEVVGVDRENRRLHVAGRPPLAYDLASIDVGITPQLDGIDGAAEHALAVKPVSTFAPRWEELRARALTPDGPRRITVVGNGAAGLEIVLAIRHRLLSEARSHGIDPGAFSFVLIGSGDLLPTHNARARAIAREELQRAQVQLIERDAVRRIESAKVHLASGRQICSDATLVTTKAAPAAWFAASGLPRDEQGFLALRPTLQLLDDDNIFAAGDCATVLDHRREKAGVFAVRQGPPLAENLRLRARGQKAVPFKPQQKFLTLVSLGERSAIASRGPLAAFGPWAWTWKDRIDRKFIESFQILPSMANAAEPSAAGRGHDDDAAMSCGGCAAKLGPGTLRAALTRIGPPLPPPAMQDLSPTDDAALLDLGGTSLRLESTDFFRAIWPEPYVLGEIVAEHALSDILAKGGTPDHALAMAQVPYAAAHLQEDDLVQLMAGARRALDRAGVAVVGGHSAQGPELAAGFFVSGSAPRDKILRKRGLAAGDTLILTKPIGTGIVFAGWMRGLARARHVTAALAGMRTSNAPAARLLVEHQATAMTDVTGFGLAGHLGEMLDGSRLVASLDLKQVRLYPGVAELASAGVQSTLLPENLGQGRLLAGSATPGRVSLAILFDPQTSGGLLAGVPDTSVEACLAALAATGIDAAIIGRLEQRTDIDAGKINLVSTLD